jgi:predicted metal-binding membrane protein
VAVIESKTGIERILARDRAMVVASLITLVLLSWIYLAILANDMAAGDMRLMGMGNTTFSMSDTSRWTLITFGFMLLMWCIMMIGMMIPSAAPMILLFAMISRKQSENRSPGTAIALFTAAYLVVWFGFSFLATFAQWLLNELTLLSPMMVANSRALTIGLLIGCGIYQLSPLKQACLGKCRSPLGFLTTRWQSGNAGALKMGLSHGIYCVGCCWLLMALLFLGGVMNLMWIVIIAVFVLAEKIVPRGDLIAGISGIAMLIVAVYLAFASLQDTLAILD